MITENFTQEQQNNKKYTSIGIYIFIAIFSLFINLPMLYVTQDFIGYIMDYLSKHLKLLQIQPFVLFSAKLLTEVLMINMFLLLIIEFVVVYLFHKRLNKLFKIDNLFTIKKFILFAIIIIIVIQMIVFCGLWFL